MRRWKVDRTMAVWGIAFGIVATLSGMFLLAAVEGGFLAEGFFLIVLFWVFIMVGIARLPGWIRRGGKKEDADDL